MVAVFPGSLGTAPKLETPQEAGRTVISKGQTLIMPLKES